MTSKIKICGLSAAQNLQTALDEGADYVGFVFFEPSPRHVSYARAGELGGAVKGRAKKVALTVDADDARFEAIMRDLDPDLLQLHGQESPERAAELKARYGRPVIKAVKVRRQEDVHQAEAYAGSADMIVYDAKPPEESPLPGGNGVTFDWSLLAGRPKDMPFMLSGGLNADNVAAAITQLHPAIVDVSSGVESSPGVKDDDLIRAFIRAARAADKVAAEA